MPRVTKEFHIKVALSPLKIQGMFFKTLFSCMKGHFCPFVPALNTVFFFSFRTVNAWAFCFLLAIKPQLLLASEVLMLHTVCYHFTCKCNLFLLKFLFQNRHANIEARRAIGLALLFSLFSKTFKSSCTQLQHCF